MSEERAIWNQKYFVGTTTVLFALTFFLAGKLSAAPSLNPKKAPSYQTVPFELIDNRIFIDVKLNEQGPYKFVFDVGSGLLVTPEVADGLKLQITGAKQVTGAAGVESSARQGTVNDVAIGSVHLPREGLNIVSLDAIKQAIGFQKIEGLIGYPLLEKYKCLIDFEKQELTIFLDVVPESILKEMKFNPIVFFKHMPTIKAKIDGVEGQFRFDTGDRSSLTVFSAFSESTGLTSKFEKALEYTTGWGIGGPLKARVKRMNTLDIEDVQIEKVPTRIPKNKSGTFADKKIAGVIGAGILRKFNVLIDYSAKRVGFRKNKFFDEELPYDRSGIWVSVEKESIKILDVAPGTPAEASKVAVGDIIEQVDGREVRAIDIFALRNKLSDSRVEQVQFRLRNDAGTREAILKLRDLI